MRIEYRKLLEDLKSFSVKQGEDFILASGQKSNIYIDVKPAMLNGTSMYNMAKLLHEYVMSFGQFNMVAGSPLGGTHLATMVAMYNPPMSVVLVRKELKDHGTQQWVELPGDLTSKRVILLEDVVTTGNSVLATAKILEDAGCTVKGIVAVVDRREDVTNPTLGNYGFRALVDFKELI